MLQVIGMAVGRMGANAYIVYEKDRYDAIIIDPGDEADRLKRELEMCIRDSLPGSLPGAGVLREVWRP